MTTSRRIGWHLAVSALVAAGTLAVTGTPAFAVLHIQCPFKKYTETGYQVGCYHGDGNDQFRVGVTCVRPSHPNVQVWTVWKYASGNTVTYSTASCGTLYTPTNGRTQFREV